MTFQPVYVVSLNEIDASQRTLVGGKAAGLGKLSRIRGLSIPAGFCVTTKAFEEITQQHPEYDRLLNELSRLQPDDAKAINEISAELRKILTGLTIPESIEREISDHLEQNGANVAYAVRSSATTEDLPDASFAGQQETYLNIVGLHALREHIAKCWASLFTDRAVAYRIRNGFDHRQVRIAVVIQKMVLPYASGVLFTADPATSNRRVLSIDASFGLGEAIVSGLVNPDTYKVRDGDIVEKKISTKTFSLQAKNGGGVAWQEIASEQQNHPVLTDTQILELERIGRRIEHHFGSPQDIEWCLTDEGFHIVQSRPITTLFPIPASDDGENHVYISVGHQQMMTDPIRPLGLSFYLLTTRAPMRTAGGRLFVDVTQMLASPESRSGLINTLGQHDPLMKDALLTFMSRADFINGTTPGEVSRPATAAPQRDTEEPNPDDAPALISELTNEFQASIDALKETIKSKSRSELLDFILEDIQRLKKILFDPRSAAAIYAPINAAIWINENVNRWLGEKNVADTLFRSIPNNITSEMGLALLDVADIIRPYSEVVAYLENTQGDDFLNGLEQFPGGVECRRAIENYLEIYGMRCVGEIDITRERWAENPSTLIPLILGNVKNFKAGESSRRYRRGLREALKKEKALLDRLAQLPDGEQKVKETKRKIDIIRKYGGYREYPKYGMVSTYFVYKQALLREADALVERGLIQDREDIYYLTFDELRNVVRSFELDYRIIADRKEAYVHYGRLTPPRVITSDGEIINGRYNLKGLPKGAIPGLAVSSGVIEGRARVVLSMENTEFGDNDILVTAFTDPSWSPVFVSVKGLVTEVGGLMTHGAVIAREYGLPAVVGVQDATRIIKDGERIRVNGTEGYVEVLGE